MHNKPVVGLSLSVSVGDSFAEFSLIENNQIQAKKRIQHSRENLKSSLQQFLLANPTLKPAQSFVAVRLSKKMIDAQLSERMAHIVTAGLQNWPKISAHTQSKLTQEDHFIPLQERILASGDIAVPLTDEELNRVATELKEQKIKKISLELLHTGRNSAHLKKASAFFTEQGFETFAPATLDAPHEIPVWNRNILNANIQNLIESRLQEVTEALEGILSADKIMSLHSKDSQAFNSEAIQSLFVAMQSVALMNPKEPVDILYLGLEKFTMLIGGATSQIWKSPWGEVYLAHQKQRDLHLQPTQGIDLNAFGRFDFSRTEEGWEPGPMFLGRAQKMTLLDLWSESSKFKKIAGLEDRIQAPGIQRFKNALYALTKISSQPQADQGLLIKELQSLMLNKLCLETQLHRENKKLIVMGPLAGVFGNAFKKSPLTTVDAEDFKESLSLLHHQAQQ